MGVNTHFGYTDEPYYSQADSISRLLRDLGIRYVRDGIDDSNWKQTWRIQRALFDNYGIRTLAVIGPRLSGTWPTPLDTSARATQTLLDTLKSRYADAVVAIEGPNEYDLSHGDAETDWVAALTVYTRMLAACVRGDPAIAGLPLIAPSLCFGHESQVGDLSSYVDCGNTHSYPGGNPPATGLASNMSNARIVCGAKPIWATETGYHTALNQPTGAGHPGVSEEAQARYLPRLFAEYFRVGIAKTLTYEFLDEKPDSAGTDLERHFGIIRYDLSAKPAYTAIRNLIRILDDDTTAFAVSPLTYALSGDTAGVRHLLLQKRDGRYYILIWQETRSFDLSTKLDLSPAPRHVTLTFASVPAGLAVYHVNESSQAVARPQAALTLDLDIPDKLYIVECTPPAGSLVSPRRAHAASAAAPPMLMLCSGPQSGLPAGAAYRLNGGAVKRGETVAHGPYVAAMAATPPRVHPQ
jgi:hypothetical protein